MNLLSEEEMEEREHNRWLLKQELGEDYYRRYENEEDDEKEDEYELIIRLQWEKRKKEPR